VKSLTQGAFEEAEVLKAGHFTTTQTAGITARIKSHNLGSEPLLLLIDEKYLLSVMGFSVCWHINFSHNPSITWPFLTLGISCSTF
jgi:hypothetical protein